ncbi:MAG: MBOAT family O-acyltransferase, partial [Phycisphaerae bacterium]
SHRTSSAKAWLLLSVGTNLGILACFKYCDFFLQSASDLLNALGVQNEPRLLNVILPVGISFYTFQTMSYTIDVYRKKLNAHDSLLQFAVFVAFFPQLVAGPICRAQELLPQIARHRSLSPDHAFTGCYWFLWGLFKKVVIADQMAALADPIFENPDYYHGGAILVAVYAFTIQIYCDFSGYTDMARGVAAILGFSLPPNFNMPYLARNPSEFWRRWHMTLSSWLRDYLYIPLGGNRWGPTRTNLNLMLTMLLGGLWHGAAWTFVIWGGFHGFLLIVYRFTESVAKRYQPLVRLTQTPMARALSGIFFFHLVCLGWLIFRAPNMTVVSQMVGKLVTPWPWWILSGANSLQGTGLFTLLVATIPLIGMYFVQRSRDWSDELLRLTATSRGFAYAGMILGIVIWGGVDDKPFIYFQF